MARAADPRGHAPLLEPVVAHAAQEVPGVAEEPPHLVAVLHLAQAPLELDEVAVAHDRRDGALPDLLVDALLLPADGHLAQARLAVVLQGRLFLEAVDARLVARDDAADGALVSALFPGGLAAVPAPAL